MPTERTASDAERATEIAARNTCSLHDCIDAIDDIRWLLSSLAALVQELDAANTFIADATRIAGEQAKRVEKLELRNWHLQAENGERVLELGADKDRIAALAKQLSDAEAFDRDVRASLHQAEARIEALTRAIRWALGEEGEFPSRGLGEPSFYWRSELRARAALSAPAEEPST